uniref:Putative secreted protein n=1 Tax=Ixodes scapularis TaxID=6945 RepID=A0A4D5S2U0_IXOSC
MRRASRSRPPWTICWSSLASSAAASTSSCGASPLPASSRARCSPRSRRRKTQRALLVRRDSSTTKWS